MTDERPLILIVDDQPVNLRLLVNALQADYRLKVAVNGTDALNLAREAVAPEVILLDLMMPDIDGYGVCTALKADPRTALIPVIFITSKTDAASETQALESGAVDFIPKPINPAVVKARVRMHRELAQHRLHLEEMVRARTRELAQARDAAENANRAKTAFLRNASHEMLTPLNHISGMAYLLHKDVSSESGEKRLAILEKAAQHMLGLVKRLLDLADLESSRMHLKSESFGLRPLLERTLDWYREAAEAKGLGLELEVASSVPEDLVGDPERLGQILAQILDNAVKFSARGAIRVSVEAEAIDHAAATLGIRVEDSGPGMPPEIAAGLFTYFTQGDDSLSRDQCGLGLGLMLCKRLLALMGGEMALDSRLGEGTTVRIRVPLDTVG